MNLYLWREILDRHGVGNNLDAATGETLDKIIEEIAVIVRRTKGEHL